jgi:hypothetical protein
MVSAQAHGVVQEDLSEECNAMDEIQLYVVSSDVPLPNCLQLMRSVQRRAIVVDHGEELTLVTAEAIAEAMNRAVERKRDPAQISVGTVRSTSPLQRHSASDFLATLMKIPAQSRLDASALARLRRMFDEQDDRHALFEMPVKDQPRARVITSSEGYAKFLGSSVIICRCAGPPPEVHTFTRDQVDEEGVCNYPHKAPLVCDEI